MPAPASTHVASAGASQQTIQLVDMSNKNASTCSYSGRLLRKYRRSLCPKMKQFGRADCPKSAQCDWLLPQGYALRQLGWLFGSALPLLTVSCSQGKPPRRRYHLSVEH